jgi:hypothetical protein
VLAALFCVHGFFVWRFTSSLLTVKQSLTAIEEQVVALELDLARTSLTEATDAMQQAQQALTVFTWMQWLPLVGDYVEAVHTGLDAGEAALQGFDAGLIVLTDVYDVVEEAEGLTQLLAVEGDPQTTLASLPDDFRIELLQTVHQAAPELIEMRTQLSLVQRQLEEIHALPIAKGIKKALEPYTETVPVLLNVVDVMIPIAQTIDEVTGLGQDRQWLLLFLNDTEMRPGGGFIGTYGLVQVRDGEIVQLTIDDSFAVDRPVQEQEDYFIEPPQPLVDYIGVDSWYFRDANWSPDVAESSQKAVELFLSEQRYEGRPGQTIDGVITMTTGVMEGLLDILGAVSVQGLTFESKTFTETLEYEVEYGFREKGIAFEERKAIIGLVADVMLERLEQLSFERWPEVIELIHELFEEKEIALFAFDESVQQAFAEAGWTADFEEASVDDFFLFVDANMAALKTDHAIERTVTYEIEPEGDRYKATARMTYRHTGTFDWRTSRYRTYVRLFVPTGSELISGSGFFVNDPLLDPARTPRGIDIDMHDRWTSFGSFTSIEPGDEHTIEFVYYLPASVTNAIDAKLYQLAALKQMGINDYALTLDLNFGKNIRTGTPAEEESEFGDTHFRLNTEVVQDSVFTIEF